MSVKKKKKQIFLYVRQSTSDLVTYVLDQEAFIRVSLDSENLEIEGVYIESVI